jgi:hypothetical protein
MRRGLVAGKNNTKDGLFALEPLFKEYGVDLAFWAHEHTYERLWPTMENKVVNSSSDKKDPYHDAAGVTHIITGAAGGREGEGGMFFFEDWLLHGRSTDVVLSVSSVFFSLLYRPRPF